jgi:hypothetical protein
MSDQYRFRDANTPVMEKVIYSCIDLFIERLDIVLSDVFPDICPWAVALPVFTYGQN